MKLDSKLPEKIALEVMALSVISGIFAGVVAQIFHVDYWVDMAFWTMTGTAFAGLILDAIISAILGIIIMFTLKKED